MRYRDTRRYKQEKKKDGKKEPKGTNTGAGEIKYERQALEHTDTQKLPRWHHASYLGFKEGSASS